MFAFLCHPLYKNLTIVYICSPLWEFCCFAGTDPALFYDSIYDKSSYSLQRVFHVTDSDQSKEKIKHMFDLLMWIYIKLGQLRDYSRVEQKTGKLIDM